MVRGAYGVGQVDDAALTAGSYRGNERPERYRAVRMVASMSQDADECRQRLEQLGLDPAEGLEGGNATK